MCILPPNIITARSVHSVDLLVGENLEGWPIVPIPMTITLVSSDRPYPVDGRSLAFSTSPHPDPRPPTTPKAVIHPATPQHHLCRQKSKDNTRVDGILRCSRQEARDVGHNDDADFLPQEFCLPPIGQHRTHQANLGPYRPPDISSNPETCLTLPVKEGWPRTWQCRCRRYHSGRSKTKMWAFSPQEASPVQNRPVETEDCVITIAPPRTRLLCAASRLVYPLICRFDYLA